MSHDRDEQVIAAYAAGDDVGDIQRRFGISAEEIERIVAAETDTVIATAETVFGAEKPRRKPFVAAGIALMVLGLVRPCPVGAVWLAVYYGSAGEYPVASLRYDNMAVGLSGICAGLVLAMIGLILFLVSRARR